jgi:hypothetical protein
MKLSSSSSSSLMYFKTGAILSWFLHGGTTSSSSWVGMSSWPFYTLIAQITCIILWILFTYTQVIHTHPVLSYTVLFIHLRPTFQFLEKCIFLNNNFSVLFFDRAAVCQKTFGTQVWTKDIIFDDQLYYFQRFGLVWIIDGNGWWLGWNFRDWPFHNITVF